MLKLESKNNTLLLTSGAGHKIAFTPGKTALCVGRGEASYTMSHGRFRFREKLAYKTILRITGFELTDAGAALFFENEDGQTALTARLSLCGDRLDVHFDDIRSRGGLNRMWIRLPATENDHIYGGGEVFSEFDLRGQKGRVWVAEHTHPAAISRKLVRERLTGPQPEHKEPFTSYETYYAQPTFVSSRKYFIHSDATAYCGFDFRHKTFHELEIRQIADLHFGFADSFPALSGLLSDLLGRQPELPDWVYDGAILGIQGGTDIVNQKLDTVKKYDTAVAGVWCQDWEGRRVTAFGKQLMWNWMWDAQLYPGLDQAIPEWKAKGVKFLGYINPFLAVEKDLYAYASAQGYCVKDKNGDDYLVKITTFPAAMADLTNPRAWNWLKDVIKTNMIGFGLDGWMADFGEYLPTDCVLYSGEDPAIVHCTWPARWAKLNREVLEETGKLGEILFFTRAGHTDTVKYSVMMWNGDQHTDWSFDCGLPSVIPATLSLAVCGFGLAHSDVGGYITFPPMQRSEELFIRWAEMSAFSPLMRSHEGNRPDDNAQFDASDEVLKNHAEMSRVHRALKPYLKAAVKENAEKGVPVMRPLFFAYDEEQAYTESTEYLLGGDVLVAPVLREGAKDREVYLPADEWVHLWTGKTYGGGEFRVDAPFGRPPVFYRKGSEFAEVFEEIGKY